MTLDVTVTAGESGLDDPAWPELFASDDDHHIFLSPEWGRLWWEEFGAGKDLFVVKMMRGGEPLAVVPLYRKHEGGRELLRFLGGIDLTDYLGPICTPEDRPEVAGALISWLQTTDIHWDTFDAHNMPVPFGFAEFLVERADSAGLDYELDIEETAAILLLPRSWDDYLAALSSKDRHELKRKRRRLEREHPDARVRTATAETLDTDLKTFFELHRGAQGHKGHFMRPEIAAFFERIARAFMPRGWLRLDLLEIGDTAVAATFAFEVENAFYLYNSAYDPDAARLSPGLVLVSELVKGSIDDGLAIFDFMRGPERYKYQLGAHTMPLHNVRIHNGR